jgi:hypothetical protein
LLKFQKKNENGRKLQFFKLSAIYWFSIQFSILWGPDLRPPAPPFIGRACWIAFRYRAAVLMGFVPGFGEITGTAGL